MEGECLEDAHAHTFLLGDLNLRLDAATLLARATDDSTQARNASDAAAASASAASAAPPQLAPDESPGAALRDAAAAAFAGLGGGLGGSAAAQEAEWRAVAAAVAGQRWEALAAVDELRALREGVLRGYIEGPLRFAPTFKLQRGRAAGAAGDAKTAAAAPVYSRKRVPAWADRVLWRSAPAAASALRQTVYRACPAVATSDHAPVCASFTLTLPPA